MREAYSRSALKPTPKVKGKSPVAIAHDKDPYEMVCALFSSLGVEQVIGRGDRCLVKPNFSSLWGLPWRGSLTSPEVLEAVVRAVREQTEAGEIIIAEGSGTQTWQCFLEFGVPEMAIKHRARPVDLNWDETYRVAVPNPYTLKELWVPRTLHRLADVVISVPVLKVWGLTAVSLNIKNMMGTAPGRHYGFAKSGLHVENLRKDEDRWIHGQSTLFSGALVDICAVNRVNLAIIDAMTAMHSMKKRAGVTFVGPKYGRDYVKIEEMNAIIAGFDPVAVDSVGCLAMSFDPKKILNLAMAEDRGLGTRDPNKILTMGAPLKTVKRKCNALTGMKEIMTD